MLGELECSALTEVGNILASSYIAAIGELTGLRLLTSPPSISIDMTAAILSTVTAAFGGLQAHALTIVTRFDGSFGPVEGYFLFIPEPGSLSIMLRALQTDA